MTPAIVIVSNYSPRSDAVKCVRFATDAEFREKFKATITPRPTYNPRLYLPADVEGGWARQPGWVVSKGSLDQLEAFFESEGGSEKREAAPKPSKETKPRASKPRASRPRARKLKKTPDDATVRLALAVDRAVRATVGVADVDAMIRQDRSTEGRMVDTHRKAPSQVDRQAAIQAECERLQRANGLASLEDDDAPSSSEDDGDGPSSESEIFEVDAPDVLFEKREPRILLVTAKTFTGEIQERPFEIRSQYDVGTAMTILSWDANMITANQMAPECWLKIWDGSMGDVFNLTATDKFVWVSATWARHA
jgi:hypothetical protein